MDAWNPIMAQTFVKRLPFWQIAVAMLTGIFVLLSVMWGVTVFLFSLEKIV